MTGAGMGGPATSSTPLIALDAVVVDCETTGLDPAQARLVEVAALGVSAGRIEDGRFLRHLVRPDVPIPPPPLRSCWRTRPVRWSAD